MAMEDKKISKTFALKKLKPESYHFWVPAASATLEVHNCLGIVLGNELKPSLPDAGVAPTATLYEAITSWETHHALAREVLLNALEDGELVKVYKLLTTKKICNR